MKCKSYFATIALLVITTQILFKSRRQEQTTPFHNSAGLFCASRFLSNNNHSASANPSAAAAICPSYFEWISRDLSPWAESGITERSIEQAARLGSMRVVIFNSRLYVYSYGHCPQSRSAFTVWGLLMFLERFPGMVGNVDLVINCKDRPVVSSTSTFLQNIFNSARSNPPPPPVFSYCTKNNTADVPFPDFSFWGWPEVNIQPWRSESQEIVAASKQVDWTKRQPVAFWKGNSRMGKLRKILRVCNLTNAVISEQNWFWESQNSFQNSKLSQQCKQRYNIYVEGAAWSASLKYKLVCGSTLLKVESEYDEFFTRALTPEVHFLPISSQQMCEGIRNEIEWGNSNPDEAEKIGKNGQEFLIREVTMQRVYDYMFHLLAQYAKLQRFEPKVPREAQLMCKSSMVTKISPSFRVLDAEDEPQPPCILQLTSPINQQKRI